MGSSDSVVASQAALDTVGHWIDGQAVAPRPEARRQPVFDPAAGAVARQVAMASPAEVDAAVQSAARAFAAWSTTPVLKRARVMFKLKELLERHADELAALITAEHGKVFTDAQGEVQRGLEVVEFACGIPQLL